MRLGIFMPWRIGGNPGLPTADQVQERAGWIEEAGLDSIWSLDTLAPQVQLRADPLSWLLTCALATRHIEVGTAVYVVSNRNPVDVAQRLLTLESLVPGRFSLGVGAGSTKSADDALGTVFEDRFKNLYKHMDVIRRLCHGEHVGEAFLNPPPGNSGPRFYLGAWASPISLKHAINEFDGWQISGGRTAAGVGTASFKHMREGLERYRSLGGTKRAMVSTVSVDLSVDAGPIGDEDHFNLNCPPAEGARRVKVLADQGWDDLLLNPRGDPTLDDLKRIRDLTPKDGRAV
ncbi:MAG: LLM class flavin-dependent oxidoreductase [Chloroflexi bacterium]|nr:LLM class flavin-dependent oxidoreductase [Chloroflexota bacterium]